MSMTAVPAEIPLPIASYGMNSAEGLQFLTNLSDEVKEAIQVVIGELIEKKIQKVIENLEKKSKLQLQHSGLS